MLTAGKLRAIMPNCGDYAELFVGPMNQYMASYGIDSPQRKAAWLGQIAVESSQLRYTHELWGPTELQKTYENREDLGNQFPGDGFKFLGRGLIPINGREKYALAGAAIGVNLILEPELLEQPDPATQSACWLWSEHDLNDFADHGNYVAITRRISGGLSHYDLRWAYFQRAKAVLGAR